MRKRETAGGRVARGTQAERVERGCRRPFLRGWTGLLAALLAVAGLHAQDYVPIPKPKPKPVAPAAQQKPRATLVVEADAACTLYLDGAEAARLAKGETKSLGVAPGEYVLKAVFPDASGAVWKQVVNVNPGQKKAVLVELAKAGGGEAAPAGGASLVLEADAACVVTVDGREVARLAAGETKTVSVSAGESSLRATSAEDPTVSWGEVEKVAHGGKKVVRIGLKTLVQAQPERLLREKYGDWKARDGERYFAYDDGRVLDAQTGLEWKAGPDSDTNYDQAVSWVGGLGGGWRMPTRAELRVLYQKGAGRQATAAEWREWAQKAGVTLTEAEISDFLIQSPTHNMTPLLNTTGWGVWAEPKDGSLAWNFVFLNGAELTNPRDYSYTERGFAVRVRPGR